jgi:rare lipoprotein A
MDGTPTMTRAVLGALALVAFGSSVGPALAEDETLAPAAVVAPADDPAQPRFIPTPEPIAPGAKFGEAFAPFDDPAIEPVEPSPDDVGTTIAGGMASWYGPGFAGRRTASGEAFNPREYTAAHRTLPFGSRVRVTMNGRSVVVRINDRGPFAAGRVIDLSQAAAEELGLRRAGSGRVELALLES